MQQSIVKFYCFVLHTLLSMFRALLYPSSGARQTDVVHSGFRMNVEVEVFSAVFSALTNRPRLGTLPPPHSYGNQRMQRQFDGLLMMGILMPETCWAVYVRQSNKILRLIVASSWVFYLSLPTVSNILLFFNVSISAVHSSYLPVHWKPGIPPCWRARMGVELPWHDLTYNFQMWKSWEIVDFLYRNAELYTKICFKKT